MFKSLSLRGKLILLLSLPILALIVSNIYSVQNSIKTIEDMKQTLYDDLYTSATLLLNADRDL